MIWPPVKAWTSKSSIEGNLFFVAINYGGKSSNRWVVLMSVLDSSLVVKVLWSQLVDSSRWESGWGKINNDKSLKLASNKSYTKTPELRSPSFDSGLTIPICKSTIRPWFYKN